jgi:hypothetical protein
MDTIYPDRRTQMDNKYPRIDLRPLEGRIEGCGRNSDRHPDRKGENLQITDIPSDMAISPQNVHRDGPFPRPAVSSAIRMSPSKVRT